MLFKRVIIHFEGNYLKAVTYATQRKMIQLRVVDVDFGKTPQLCHLKSHSKAEGPELNSCPLLLLVTPGK